MFFQLKIPLFDPRIQVNYFKPLKFHRKVFLWVERKMFFGNFWNLLDVSDSFLVIIAIVKFTIQRHMK